MDIPEHLWRYPTRAAIDSLAKRFRLPNEPDMQDWEWEVADPGRIGEFLAAYEGGELSDDERFTLMETMLQSFEDLPGPLDDDTRWLRLLEILESNIVLHGHTIWYWSALGSKDLGDCWRITAFLRPILATHRRMLEGNRGAG